MVNCPAWQLAILVFMRSFRAGPYTLYMQSLSKLKWFHGSKRFNFTGSWSATHVLLSFVCPLFCFLVGARTYLHITVQSMYNVLTEKIIIIILQAVD